MWIDVIDQETPTLVTQARFEGVKLFQPGPDGPGGHWTEAASFNIAHTGFCRGYIDHTNTEADTVMVVASEQSKVVVSKLVQTFIRHIASLVRSGSGNVMSVTSTGTNVARLMAGYEDGTVVLWDWSNSVQLMEVSLASQVGTLLSLAWDGVKNRGLVAGTERTVVVIDDNLNIVKTRDITNPGVASTMVRPDGNIVICGGWDGRLRLFSWVKPDKLKPLAVLKYHSDSVETLLCSDQCGGRLEGRRNIIFAGSKDGKISMWDIY